MQFGEDPSISHVANRFMGTGLLRAPLPWKLSRPLLSAMVRDSPTQSWEWGGVDVSADRGGSSVFGVWVRVREVERPHAHGEAEDELISPSRLGGRAARGGTAVGRRAGASAELLVATTPLRRCEG